MDANPDLPVGRFAPDRKLLHMAHNKMLADEPHRVRFVRQRWEEAFGAMKVTLDALREIYPTEQDVLTDRGWVALGDALTHVTAAYVALDSLTEEVLGETMTNVLQGHITQPEQIKDAGCD